MLTASLARVPKVEGELMLERVTVFAALAVPANNDAVVPNPPVVVRGVTEE
jgi:hypothetical protein